MNQGHVLAAGSGLPYCIVCRQTLRDRDSTWLVSEVCPGRPVDSHAPQSPEPSPKTGSNQQKENL